VLWKIIGINFFLQLPLILGVTSQEAAWLAAPFYGEKNLNKLKQMDKDFLSYLDSMQTHMMSEEVSIK